MVNVAEEQRQKFADELFTWRERFHYKARALRVPESYARVPGWARGQLVRHADDPRPELETFDALVHGETGDETWNACQKQYLIDGWMHNNLRMHWAKRLLAMTPDPRTGWAAACYLNDRLSLNGRDPSTHGNLAWPGLGAMRLRVIATIRFTPCCRPERTAQSASVREGPNGW